ncbi:PREDICTED: uncharacterized protein LOC108579389 [Habropoda laboriosa]|uniref:uncharacterized protein LOC108579389 n=1 Tax=Habropoda laboriosa TaxID=597456 RepID=UPI00083CB36A|nr:PREDICTED: uncharacterized protein LOC108579389 [Habropoda laboriosa]
MLLLLTRRVPTSYPVLALIATNLVISMPAPPFKRSPEDPPSGFSSVPKILEIQLPLKIATKDDLVAWAKYVMGLMASRINITLTTVKESPSKNTGSARPPDTVRQSQNSRNPSFKHFDGVKTSNGVQQFANSKTPENVRYAENVRNLGQTVNYDQGKIPANVRPLQSGRFPEHIRNALNSGNLQASKNTHLPSFTITGVTTKNFFNNRQLQPTFGNIAISDTTLPSPLDITRHINIQKSGIKEPIFKGTFDTTNSLKPGEQQLFVPQFPDFGPAIEVKINDIFRNTNAVSPPTRTYLPVTTTTDSIKFPTDPFATRYFFDGVERNVSNNLGVFSSDVTFTTHSPLAFNDEIPLPVKSIDLSPQQRNLTLTTPIQPLYKLPFEAVITFTREEPFETTTLNNDRGQLFTVVPTRGPLEQFPPYFDRNYTLTKESGQVNVVFDDGTQVTQSLNNTREERKKQGKQKDSSKRQQSKKQKSSKGQTSPIGQLLKTFVALRRNNTKPAEDLSPPPLNQEAPLFTTQGVPTRQRLPQRTQLYPTDRPPSIRQGKRNRTSLAQELEDDEDSGSRESTSNEDTGSNESNGNNNESGNVESGEGSKGSAESASSESDYDDDSEEEGGSVKALIDLLQLAAPILEDLSDPDSDADISDVLQAALPIIQELSEADGEGFDIPAILVPILLQFSEGRDGMRDSAAILTPVLQLIAPLIGPLVGPLVVPLSRQSSQPPGQGGSSVGDLVKGLLGPLLEPAGPGKMSPLSNLLAGVISSLSKNSGKGGKSDIMSLVKAIVAGSVAGTSAGSSGTTKDSYGAPTSYGAEYSPSTTYGRPNTPPTNPNPLLMLGSSIKDILNAVVKVVSSLVNAITSILGASSNSSNEPQRPSYGPPPPPYANRKPYRMPPDEPISITTREPPRLTRF